MLSDAKIKLVRMGGWVVVTIENIAISASSLCLATTCKGRQMQNNDHKFLLLNWTIANISVFFSNFCRTQFGLNFHLIWLWSKGTLSLFELLINCGRIQLIFSLDWVWLSSTQNCWDFFRSNLLKKRIKQYKLGHTRPINIWILETSFLNTYKRMTNEQTETPYKVSPPESRKLQYLYDQRVTLIS